MMYEKIKENMVKAMKAQDKNRKDVYAYMAGRLEAERKSRQNKDNPNPTLSEADEQNIIARLLKENEDAIKATQSKGEIDNDFIEKLRFENEIYLEFLPKQMTEDEIRDLVQSLITEMINAGKVINKGTVMKEIIPATKGKANGKLVSQIVDAELK